MFDQVHESEVLITRDGPFVLRSGRSIPELKLAYKMFSSRLSPNQNWHLVFHGLSGSHKMEEWWPHALSQETSFAKEGDNIICFNALGSCYGSTGPTSENPDTGREYGLEFPFFDIYDSVIAVAAALKILNISVLKSAIGSSFGGMQAIVFACLFPDRVQSVISIAGSPLSPLSRAMMSIERLLVASEIEVRKLNNSRHDNLFAFARSIQYGTCIAHEVSHDKFSNDVHLDYSKGWSQSFSHQFSDIWNKCLDFATRFDPASFVILNSLVESFEVQNVSQFQPKPSVLLIGIDTDNLTPMSEIQKLMRELVSFGFQTTVKCLSSRHGHVGWLFDPIPFIAEVRNQLQVIENIE